MEELFGTLTPFVLLAMIPGLAQVFKTWFELEGTPAEVLTFAIGFILFFSFQLQGVFGAVFAQWFVIVLYSILAPLTVMGYYKMTISENG